MRVEGGMFPRSAPAVLSCALIATSVLVIATAFATLMPSSRIVNAPGSDKLHHVLAFAILALPLAVARPRWIPVTGLLLAVYGGLIEIIQPWVGRSRDLADWQADLAGILLGSLLGLALRPLLLRLWHRTRV